MDKIKVYLDTNTIHDYFVNQANFVKGKEVIIPEKFKFLNQSLDKIDFVTSFLTKAEIMRELVSAHNIDETIFENLWKDTMASLYCSYIKEFTFDEKLVDVVRATKMRLRTMFNFMHLFIAIHENAYFLSGDKDIILKIRENKVYDKALSYIELRQMFSDAS